MTIEAFHICHSDLTTNDLENIEENQEIKVLMQEIKSTPLKNISNPEIQLKCVSFILLLVKKFKHLQCCFYIIGENVIKTHEQAIKFYKRFAKILLIYVIVVPLCFVANTIIERKELDVKVPKAIISIIKAATTIFCMYNLIYFVKNLEHTLKEYGLLLKFFCIKLIIIFVIVQTIVLSFATVETEYHTKSEMGNIINFFMLNIENCMLGFLWMVSFGFDGLCLDKLKTLRANHNSKMAALPKQDEKTDVLENKGNLNF